MSIRKLFASKTKLFVLVFIFVLSQLSAQSLRVEHITTTPVIDGVYDPVWDSMDYHLIDFNNQGTVSSTDDLSGKFKIAWTNDSIFMFVLVEDDVLHSDAEVNVWNDDGLEIYFDIGNDKQDSYGADDFNYQIRYDDATVHEAAHGEVTNVELAQSVNGDTVIYEMVFPLSTLSLTNQMNDLHLGFDIHINDDDNNGSRDGKLAWFSQYDESSADPSFFGSIILKGKPMAVRADKPYFSTKRGYYQSAFTLTVSSLIAGAQIVYTLDGSNPVFSNTSLQASSPASISIDPASSTNRGGQTPGVIVRAAVIADGYSISKVATHTYLFADEVKLQDDPDGFWNNPLSNFAWPDYYGPQSIGYKMNRVQTQSAAYGNLVDDALYDIPSYSIVTEYDDMFDPASGIYMNALTDGWERAVSLELIDPKRNEDFQADAAIRMRGRYSRLPRNPKHSFRILFKDDYGPSKLRYKVFGNDGAKKFDHLDFRTEQNYAWNSTESHSLHTYLKEIYSRDAQADMGWDHTRSYHCHLYLNGMYWGLYQIQERADAKFAEEYFGDDEDDYDVVKPQKNVPDPPNDLLTGVSDGNLDAASRLWDAMIAGFSSNADYFRVQGKNADGSLNSSYERLLDVENLIDYLLIAFYMGSNDGPGVTWEGLWGQMVRPNNFIGIYNRNNPDGFKWIVHDMEKSMENLYDNRYTTGLGASWYSHDFSAFNPLTVHKELLSNDEYKVVFADRVNKYFGNDKLFSPTVVDEMMAFRKSEIDLAIIAEAARWSWWVSYNYSENSAPTKADWESNVGNLFTGYIPLRTDIVLQQFENFGISIDLDSPELLELGVPLREDAVDVIEGALLTLANPNSSGTIYYTTTGDDPRAVGGATASGAISASHGEILSIVDGTPFKARVKNGSIWSPIYEIQLNVTKEFPLLQITEVHYHPKNDSTIRSRDLEFIELKNVSAIPIDLNGFSFINGINYEFGSTTLQPDEFFVLASNLDTFNLRYGFAADDWFEGNLDNGGEKIVMHDASGSIILEFDYSDNDPWPALADGFGYSLVPSAESSSYSPDDSEYWRSSTNIHGSPNADDPEPTVVPIVINEVLTKDISPQVDQIELYNPNSTAVQIGNWFLSDERGNPDKWQIPADTEIPANGYVTFNAGHYSGETLLFTDNEFGSAFLLNSDGEEVCLSSATADSTLTGFSTCTEFGISEPNVSFGIHTNSIGVTYFVAQEGNSFSGVNTYPQVGPVVFSEIMYNVPDTLYEFVKLQNISSENVDLFSSENAQYTWKIEGIDFEFPTGITLNAGDSVYIIQAGITSTQFKTAYEITEDIQIYNMLGMLSDGGETLTIKKPEVTNNTNRIATPGYIVVEKVRYDDADPWPQLADGFGYALVRDELTDFANDPASWTIRSSSPVIIPPADIQENYASDNISIYPNPTNGDLYIMMNDISNKVVIRDVSGRTMMNQVVDQHYTFVDISGYRSGIYFVTISNSEGTVTQRIVKN